MWEITNEKGLEFIESIFFNKIGLLHMLTRIYFKYFPRDGKDKTEFVKWGSKPMQYDPSL